MSDKITKITDSNFDSLVIIPKKPAVVCFSASWSGPSRMIRPTLENAADKYRGKVTFYELDVDENPIIQMAYGVRSVPTILLFAGGQLVDRYIGTITRDKLEEKLEKIAASGELYKNMVAFSKKFAVGLGKRFGV
ncbi:MAG TPA: thioredoxin domain-containing protein [Pyrinomonadaceae bacterium]|nr:thioredoxin domain-containing protein [Pyrinomonadaceae bacterium]